MKGEAPRRRASSEATRSRLLLAASELFLANGYEATPVRPIADRAGVTIGALYGHFASKRVILYEVVRGMNQVDSRQNLPFPTLAHRALVLTVASLAHEEVEAAAVLTEVLQVLASSAEAVVDAKKAGELLVNLTERMI